MKKINGFFKLTVLAIYLAVAYKILQIAFALFTVIVIQRALTGTDVGSSLDIIDSAGAIDNIVATVIAISLAVSFLGWFYLSYKKVQQGSNRSFSFKPIFALFSFIIPILNLFAPYRIMHDIWAGENRDPSQEEKGRKLINVWWFLGLIIFFYSRYCKYKFNHISDSQQFVTAQYYYLIYYAVSIHYLLSLIKLLRMISHKQNYYKEYQPEKA